MNSGQKALYDQRVAKQIKELKSANLEIHIPLRGTPFFRPRSIKFSRLTGKRKE